jgi:hypothetical protein
MNDMGDLQQFDEEFQDAQDAELGGMWVIVWPVLALAAVIGCAWFSGLLSEMTR